MHGAFASDQAILSTALQDIFRERDILPTTVLGQDIHRILHAPGKLFSSESSRLPAGYWGLLPLSLARYCAATNVNTLLTLRASLCCELLHSALDTFDEIEDDDHSNVRDELGDGRFLNAATFLYTLLPSLFDDASLSHEHGHALQRLFTSELLSAMRGQHLDIISEREDIASFLPEVCLQIAMAKSGGLFRLVCQMGAQSVNAPASLVQDIANVGQLMGIVSQLENDAHGLEVELREGETSSKSDLRRGKKTLPLILAHRQFIALHQTTSCADKQEQRERDARSHATAYHNAIVATLGAATQLREQARTLVEGIEQVQGPMPQALRMLLTLDTVYQ